MKRWAYCGTPWCAAARRNRRDRAGGVPHARQPGTGLAELRAEGLIDHIGVAGGPVDLLRRFVDLGVLAAVITHNRYTLLDRSAGPLLEECAAAGAGLLNAAPFGGGMLGKGAATAPRYGYRLAPAPVRECAQAMQRACERAGVPLAAAALQFSLRDPRVAATIVGTTRPERLAQTLDLAAHPVPDELWAELDALTPPPDHWLG